MVGVLSVVAKWGPQRVMLGLRPGSDLPMLRDLLTHDFLRSGAKYMLAVDSDQGWSVSHLEALMSHDVEAVSALNTKKDLENQTMPAVWSGQRGTVNEKALIGAHYVGAGFLLLRRDMVLKMFESYKESLSYPVDGSDIKNGAAVALWHPICHEGPITRLSEDYSFCKRATDLGFSFWVDPAVRVEHVGLHVFRPDLEKCAVAWAEKKDGV